MADTVVKGFTLAIVIMLVVFRVFILYYTVEGISMQPTFYQDHRFFTVSYAVLRYIPLIESGELPRRGDIIAFNPPLGYEQDFVKRIVGVPGDVVNIVDGQVYVNGTATSYVDGFTRLGSQPLPVTVDPGEYFVLGDNRAHSSDSRYWGTVSRGDINGRAWAIVWPLNAVEVF